MIIEKNQVFGDTTDLKEIKFSPDGGMLKNFFQNLYANPHYAVIREYAANMQDSNPSGRKNIISFVEGNSFSGESNYISFRDFGSGISLEFLDGDFLLIGRSTKTTDNEAIGGFGVGRFCGFAVTELIKFISYYNGKKYTTELTLSDKGYGRTPILEEPTDEENGLEVIVYIDEDFNNYRKYLKYLFMLNIEFNPLLENFPIKYQEYEEYIVLESTEAIIAMNNKIAYIDPDRWKYNWRGIVRRIIPKVNVEPTLERERLKDDIHYNYYYNLHAEVLLKDVESIYDVPDLSVINIDSVRNLITTSSRYYDIDLKKVVKSAIGRRKDYIVYKYHRKTGITKLDDLIQKWVDELPTIEPKRNLGTGTSNYVLVYELQNRKLTSRKQFCTYNLVYIRRDLFDVSYLKLFPEYNFIDNCNLKNVEYLTQEQFEQKELERLELATLWKKFPEKVVALNNLYNDTGGIDELKKFTMYHYEVKKHFDNDILKKELFDMYNKYNLFIDIKVVAGKPKFKTLIELCLATLSRN